MDDSDPIEIKISIVTQKNNIIQVKWYKINGIQVIITCRQTKTLNYLAESFICEKYLNITYRYSKIWESFQELSQKYQG